MKTTRSFDLKVMKLTRAVNMVVKQATSSVACAGFENTKKYKDSKLTTAQIAAILNYGSPATNLVPRPFMEYAITGDGKRRINKVIRKHLDTLFREEIQNIAKYEDFGPARYSKRRVMAMMKEIAQVQYDNIMRGIGKARDIPLTEEYKHYSGKDFFLDGSEDFIAQIHPWIYEEK